MKTYGIVRLVADPEVRYSANGNAVASFRVAENRRFKREGQPDADFFGCTAFGKTAEFAEKYLKKGMKVFIEGNNQNDNYTGKDGKTVYRDKIIVDNIQFAEAKSNGSVPADPQESAPDEFMQIDDIDDMDELPFA